MPIKCLPKDSLKIIQSIFLSKSAKSKMIPQALYYFAFNNLSRCKHKYIIIDVL